NFLSLITLKAKAGGGVGQESFLFDICEYILVYGKSNNSNKNYIPFIETDLEENTTKVYNKIIVDLGKEKKLKKIIGGNSGDIEVFEHENFEIKNLKRNERTNENYYKYFESIFRTTNPQGGLMLRVIPQIPQKGLVSIEYIPTKGKSAGEKYRYYFLDGALIVWLKDSAIKDKEKKVVYKLAKSDNFWSDNLHQGIANEGGVELKAGKKPERVINKIIEMVTKPNDIVLDYHLGCGTTGAVAHKMGRQYIGIEQLNYEENGSVTRLKKVIGIEKSNGKLSPTIESFDESGISKSVNWKGGGDFVYCELARYNDDFIEKIYKAQNTKELLKIWEEMKEKSFINYNVDIKTAEEHLEDFKQLPTNKQKEILIQMLNKNQLYVNLSEIEDSHFKVNREDKELNKKFYG
ncbi:MAG: site-specific DNA-methyltransferase, partial [Pseudorhodobacter sp.]|nr:site-specific DNA-methyltransferase [Pseudorhodobacter sp.]